MIRFSFTEDQRLLADAVREVLAKTCPPAAVRAAGADGGEGGDGAARLGAPWRVLAEVGLLGAHVPEEHGGLGLTPVDTVLAYEQLGRFAVPGPVVETAVAAPELLGSDDAGAARLADLAAGKIVVSVRTSGTPFLLDADLADLLVTESEQGAVLAHPGQAALTRHGSVDATRRLFSADLTGAPAGVAADPVVRAAFERAFDAAALMTAAELVGLGRGLLDAAVAYAGQRRQFGKVIGSFQALKHQLADVAIAIDFAAPLVYRAAYAMTHEAPSAARDVSIAKLRAGAAAHRAARTALQVHGAIGYTDELDLHLWLTRVWALRAAWGDDTLHRARLRSEILQAPLAALLP